MAEHMFPKIKKDKIPKVENPILRDIIRQIEKDKDEIFKDMSPSERNEYIAYFSKSYDDHTALGPKSRYSDHSALGPKSSKYDDHQALGPKKSKYDDHTALGPG